VHWSDGGVIDLDRVAPTLRARGAALIIDATHAAGVMPLDVNKLDPDFLVFPTYKWVLGPYGRAFLYIAKRHQDGIPLEQTGMVGAASRRERRPICATSRLSPARAASIWASVTISYLWKWPRSEWR
jgi:selenocysteine lyase/cysteine desulfurase